MTAALLRLRPGRQEVSHIVALAGNDGKFLPTLVMVVEYGTQVMLARYRDIDMLPQGRIFEYERFEDTSHRILTDEFGMDLPSVGSDAWSASVTQIAFYHRSELGDERRTLQVWGKMLVFVKVTVSSMATNLSTEWNSTREPNPPKAVTWVNVESLEDIDTVRTRHFNRIRTDAKREAELAIIAIARGMKHALNS